MRRFFLLLVILANHHVAGKDNEVRIIDRVPNQPSLLRVRCQSKNDDLGLRTLYQGQSFNWFFNPRGFIDNTLFFCHFYWGSKQKIFNVYDKNIEKDYCDHVYDKTYCYWEARPDGFYVNSDSTPWIKITDWE